MFEPSDLIHSYTRAQAIEDGVLVDVGLTRSTHRLVRLKALCGAGDALEPVVTIMLPSED
ncbi:TPA: hypothetical protein ACKP7S_000363 [Stenotrophomonas maltophilia]